MFLLKCDDGKIHFEFPMFEDHSYNTICNRIGMRILIRRKAKVKYIIFRTKDIDLKKRYIMGFYKIGKTYFQETKKFNNNGFVCGIESSEVCLLRKGEIILQDKTIKRGHRSSWTSEERNEQLSNFLEEIKSKGHDFSERYRNDTNRLIQLFKDKSKIDEWKNHCMSCSDQEECFFFKYNEKFIEKKPHTNMYEIINKIYNTNVYSRNILENIPKRYIR